MTPVVAVFLSGRPLWTSPEINAADAFIAATAIRHNAVLIHKDPEFDALKPIVRQHALPYKDER